MKKRTIIIWLVLSMLAAFGLSAWEVTQEFGRLEVIRLTKDLPIPEWIKAWIWGWR